MCSLMARLSVQSTVGILSTENEGVDWVPELEGVEAPTSPLEDDVIFRVVAVPETDPWYGRSARFRKPYYSTYAGAKKALHYFDEGSYIQKSIVNWEDVRE